MTRSAAVFLFVAITFFFVLVPETAHAQPFAGSNVNSWTCAGTTAPGATPSYDRTLGKFTCAPGVDALPKPPTLRQAEIWFATIIYALWGLAGLFFTGTLMYLGFMYMVSQGESKGMETLKENFGKWFIGFALVFLSYPILSTVFSFIGVNTCLTREIQLPGFQFFFERVVDPSTCT